MRCTAVLVKCRLVDGQIAWVRPSELGLKGHCMCAQQRSKRTIKPSQRAQEASPLLVKKPDATPRSTKTGKVRGDLLANADDVWLSDIWGASCQYYT